MAAYAAHTTNYNTHLLTAQIKKKTRATQKSPPFRKWKFRENQIRRIAQKQKKDKTQKSTGLGRRTREDI